MNVPALIRLCNDGGAALPPLPDAYQHAEYNDPKRLNAQTAYQIPGMDGVPNLNAALLPFPSAGRLLSGSDSGVVAFPTGSTTVSISTNVPGSISQPLWHLLDNNQNSAMRYNGNFGTVPFFTVDFGRLETLSQFGITASDQSSEVVHAPISIQLETSENGTSFSSVNFYSGQSWVVGERKIYSFTPVLCQFVRVGFFMSGSGSSAIVAAFDFA